MLRSAVLQAHIVPRAVSDVLGEASAVGCSRGPSCSYGWALHRQSLLLWRVEDGLAAGVRRLTLSEPPEGRAFVEVVPHAGSSAVTVVVCTGGGQLNVWLDAAFPAPPFAQRLCVGAGGGGGSAAAGEPVVCALSAAPADAGSSLGFVAVVATADGALHLYHGSQAGIFPRLFHRPSAAPGPKPGVLGALGSVVKALYCEAFDPLHNVARAGPSVMAALQLSLRQLDAGRWRLLVLTPEALDCWALGTAAGQQSSEALLWSYNLHGVLGHELKARELTALAFAAGAAQPPAAAGEPPQPAQLYVWTAHLGATSLAHSHALSCFDLESAGAVPRYVGSAPLGAAAPLPAPDGLGQWRLVPHSQLHSCLALAPDGAVFEWAADSDTPAPLGSSPEHLAIGCCRPSAAGGPDSWQLLNASYGVLEFGPQLPTDHGAGDAAQQPAGEMTPDREAAAAQLLSRTVELMFKEFAAGCPYRDLAQGLGERLERLGAFEGGSGPRMLVSASSSLVDRMPKAGAGLGAGFSSASLRGELRDKQVHHDLLIAAYQAGGVLPRLAPAQARAVFEHAEALAAVAAVLEWQRQQEAAALPSAPLSGVAAAQVQAAAAAIEAAGALASAGADGGAAAAPSDGQQWAVFFSRPTASVPALFRSVAAKAAAISQHLDDDRSAGSSTLVAAQHLLGLAGLLQAAVAGAQAKVAEFAEHMGGEVQRQGAAPGTWLAGEEAISAWGELAQACLVMHSRLLEPPQRLQLALRAHLPALEALLVGLREAIQHSASPPAALREEYARAPEEHGAALLQSAEEELNGMRASGLLAAAAEAAAAGPLADEAGAESIAAVQHALVWPVEQLAQQHRCHPLLFDTCELLLSTGLLDGQRLQMHMRHEVHEAGGAGQLPPSSFTFYVMERWRASGQLSSLLQLGRQGFLQQLQQFLQSYPSLLWMSQVQGGMVAEAARTLAEAAKAEQGSVAKCRRLLCLTKLAARAASGEAPGTEQQLQLGASARLRQLALQEQLQLGREPPLTTAQLALAALAAAEAPDGAGAAVAAVEALALAPDQRSEQYRELWERSWLAVLQRTPLGELAQARAASRQAGGAPQAFEEALRCSPLAVAVLRAAAALADAGRVQPGLSPAEVLDATGAALVSRITQEQPGALDCVQDLLAQAAQEASALLASSA